MAHVLDDSQCESSTILEDNSEEIPKLVRVFCGLDSAQQSNQHDCFCNGFDYKAATELLRREPSQVRYTTYEYRKRRRNSVPEKGSGYTFSKYGGNIFLHSPLRWACIETTQEQDAMEFLETVRDIDPTQFLFQDSHGQLPIDGQCVLDASLELLQFLLNIYLEYDLICPNGVGMLGGNFNPITCLSGSYWSEDIQTATEEIRSGKRTVTGRNVLEDNLGIENNFWKKIILLTKAFYHKTIDEECIDTGSDCNSSTSMLRITNEYADRRIQFRLLHACAGIDWFPPNLLRLLVAAFPKALLEEDEDGNLPIHIASGGFFESYKTIDVNSWDSEDLEAHSGYQKTTIDIFLEANPTLARIPDAEGRLPLELALESGNTLANCSHHKRWRPWDDGGIGSLLDAFPEAARIRSAVTGKLPLEITLGKGSYRDWEDGVQALLAVYPEAARTKSPTTGKYPLQLAIERETHFDRGIFALVEVSPDAIWASRSAVANPLREEENNGPARKRRKVCIDNKYQKRPAACVPMFAHAALENCSASVIYKLLRRNPETCRRRFENASSNKHK